MNPVCTGSTYLSILYFIPGRGKVQAYFIENLRIFDEGKKDCGLLKISQFSGRNPDGRYYFSAAYALEKSNSPRMSLNLILKEILQNVF